MTSREQMAPNLWRLEREGTGVPIWVATWGGISLMSYSEQYAREWLAQQQGSGPEAA